MSKKKVRENFRNEVFERDKYTCKKCKRKLPEEQLDAHHIVDRHLMPNGGYVKENGITLCKDKCHMLAEKFHISGGAEWTDGMHPNDLYKMIGSSYELAVEKSNEL